MAMQSMLPEFDFFRPKCLQTSIESDYDLKIAPKNAITEDSQIEFVIDKADNTYTDLSNTKLSVTFKVTKEDNDNSDLADAAKISAVNLMLHSLFSSVTLTLNDTKVTESDALYPYRAYIETLLNYDKNMQNTLGYVAGFHKETGTSNTYADANAGLAARRDRIAKSNKVTVTGRPHVDLFNQELDLPSNVKAVLTLTRTSGKFFLITPSGGDKVEAKVVITDAELYVRRKKVSPSLALAHAELLRETNIRIPYTKVRMIKRAISAGVAATTLNSIFAEGQAPARVFVALVDNEAQAGDLHKNPFFFANYGLTNVSLKIDTASYPAYTYKDRRGYMSLLDACGADVGPQTIGITPLEWEQGHRLYGFRILPTLPSSGAESVQVGGNGELELSFNAPLAVPVTAIIYAEYPGLVEITSNNEVIVL